MYDARLVQAAQEGDDAAFAALYDRCADAVYDLCWAITGDDAEAARLVEEAFALAAENLASLSDASQVRPWLLAIARDQALADDTDGVLHCAWGMTPGLPAGTEPLQAGPLRRWAQEATAVLALADQITVQLQLRHNLDDEQLASIIGTSVDQLAAVGEQVDAEAVMVLSALVLARQGQEGCPDLAAMLAEWDGHPSVDVADSVDAHAASCRRCAARRALIDPLELVAEAPVIAAPAGLRSRILERVAPSLAALAASAPKPRPAAGAGDPGPPTQVTPMTQVQSAYRDASRVEPPADPAGPPVPKPDDRRSRLAAAPVIGLVAGVLVITGVAILVLNRPSKSPKTTVGVGTTIAPGSTVPQTTAAPVGPPPTIVPVDSTTSTTAAPPQQLALNTAEVDLGAGATTAQVVLSNPGGSVATWHATVGVPWLTVAPPSGQLEPGQSVAITFTINRAAAPNGGFDQRVVFTGSTSATQAALQVIGSNEPTTTTASTSTTTPPSIVISNVAASPSTVYTSPCALKPTTSTVSANVTDASGTPTAELFYTLPNGTHGSTPMTSLTGNTYSASLPSSSTTGTITYTVSASDGGAPVSSPTGSVTVASCA